MADGAALQPGAAEPVADGPAAGRSMVTVVVRYFAAARAAAGVTEEKLSVPAPASVGDVLRVAVTEHGARLGRVLDRCSYLLDEIAVHPAAVPTTPLSEGQLLDVLPPFAGG